MKVKELQPSHLYCRRGTQSRPLPLSALWWFPLPPPILWATPFGVFTPPPPPEHWFVYLASPQCDPKQHTLAVWRWEAKDRSRGLRGSPATGQERPDFPAMSPCPFPPCFLLRLLCCPLLLPCTLPCTEDTGTPGAPTRVAAAPGGSKLWVVRPAQVWSQEGASLRRTDCLVR